MSTGAPQDGLGSSRGRQRIVVVHNFCTHYTLRTFELMARRLDVQFYFLSRGDEWYWLKQHGVRNGAFSHEYVPSIRLMGLRLNPGLASRLWRGGYHVFIKSLTHAWAVFLTFLVARLRRRPFILWTGVWSPLLGWVHRLGRPVTTFIYRHADALIVYGEHVRRFLITQGVEPRRIFVAPHAVDNKAYSQPVPTAELDRLRSRLGIGREARIVLYLGRLEVAKGVGYLLEAFENLASRDAVLVLAGEGGQRSALETWVRNRGLSDRVRFTGYVPVEDVRQFYALAQVCVLPSITTPNFREPWGLVVNEAFNQQVPVVATDAVGAAAGGLLEDGVSGYVVPECDAGALGAALDRILRDEDLRTRMGAAAKAAVCEWTQERMVAAFEQAIRHAVGSSGTRFPRRAKGRSGATPALPAL